MFKKVFKTTSKWVAELEAYTNGISIPRNVKDKDKDDLRREFNYMRKTFNNYMINSLIGATLEENKKGDWHLTNYRMFPNSIEMVKIVKSANKFIHDIEPAWDDKIGGIFDSDDNKLDESIEDIIGRDGSIKPPTKITHDTFIKFLVSSINTNMNLEDFLTIGATARQLRNKTGKTVGIIVGGVLILAGAGYAGHKLYNNHQKKNSLTENSEAFADDDAEWFVAPDDDDWDAADVVDDIDAAEMAQTGIDMLQGVVDGDPGITVETF